MYNIALPALRCYHAFATTTLPWFYTCWPRLPHNHLTRYRVYCTCPAYGILLSR